MEPERTASANIRAWTTIYLDNGRGQRMWRNAFDSVYWNLHKILFYAYISYPYPIRQFFYNFFYKQNAIYLFFSLFYSVVVVCIACNTILPYIFLFRLFFCLLLLLISLNIIIFFFFFFFLLLVFFFFLPILFFPMLIIINTIIVIIIITTSIVLSPSLSLFKYYYLFINYCILCTLISNFLSGWLLLCSSSQFSSLPTSQ